MSSHPSEFVSLDALGSVMSMANLPPSYGVPFGPYFLGTAAGCS